MGSLESQKATITLTRSPFSHSRQCLDLPAESWGSLAWCFGGKACPIAHVFHVEHVSDGA